jgi:protein-disulfide isomerase
MLKSFFAACLVLLAVSAGALADDASSTLKPPHGSKVAIVMFEDLECPDCANAYPMVWETANARNIPVVLHDYPLPFHKWSFDAAVWARYFDTKDTKTQNVGNEFRRFIYANQRQITKDNLQQWVQKFGNDNKVPVPFAKDPDGSLTEKVRADYALGQRLAIQGTPTIWVVGNTSSPQPLAEQVKDRGQLGQIIDDVSAKAQPVGPAKSTPAKKGGARPKKQSAQAAK